MGRRSGYRAHKSPVEWFQKRDRQAQAAGQLCASLQVNESLALRQNSKTASNSDKC
jgi:hypothetical protein